MEENAVSSYLWSKFSSILREVEADSSSPSQIISRFQSIERRIDSMHQLIVHVSQSTICTTSSMRSLSAASSPTTVTKRGRPRRASFGSSSLINLLEELHRRLKGVRYLIVLDNVWRMDKWYPADVGEFVSHGLLKESGGGVIVTSTRDNVIRRTIRDDHKAKSSRGIQNGI
ncbi:hypothetical protein BUALT_Bualt01G0161300 [Buddleja alternifolia]|uniref:NB-ARC domain-containing protein n=1 Tax=Buddleja alternifolia TaxID=168488 RepID=A0AAV6Y8M6_9LAMI|nr:hypothetical protein BUALT_Bualt01G0161300 [Buddleja alternifolia]